MPNIKRVMMGAAGGAGVSGDDLYVWGDGAGGRLGLGDTASRSSPVQLGDSEWKSAIPGGRQGLGIKSDDKIYAWGINTSGEVGDGTAISKSSPVQIGSLSWAWVGGGSAFRLGVAMELGGSASVLL